MLVAVYVTHNKMKWMKEWTLVLECCSLVSQDSLDQWWLHRSKCRYSYIAGCVKFDLFSGEKTAHVPRMCLFRDPWSHWITMIQYGATTHGDSLTVRKLISKPWSKYADDYDFSVCKLVSTAFISNPCYFYWFPALWFMLCKAYSKL